MTLVPQPNSKRSKRRKNRQFRSLEESTRKGRRLSRRIGHSCTFFNKTHKLGEKEVNPTTGLQYTAGGSRKCH